MTATHAIERTTPPSTRRAAPFIAEASGLQTKATAAATSSGVAKALNDGGRAGGSEEPRSKDSQSVARSLDNLSTNWTTPSDAVGPGSTALTVLAS
jgi:hypothetical protein